jgi:hypothetical protein
MPVALKALQHEKRTGAISSFVAINYFEKSSVK